MEARKEFLDLAEACGARISGKPDGSEPVEVVFSIDAWRAFDAAQSPAALAGEREAEVIAKAFHAELALLPATMRRTIIDSLERDESNSWKFFRSGWHAALASRPTTQAPEPVNNDGAGIRFQAEMNGPFMAAKDLARRIAFAGRDKHDYLPQTIEAAKTWTPHDWVIRAMRDYAEAMVLQTPAVVTQAPTEPALSDMQEMVDGFGVRSLQRKGLYTALSAETIIEKVNDLVDKVWACAPGTTRYQVPEFDALQADIAVDIHALANLDDTPAVLPVEALAPSDEQPVAFTTPGHLKALRERKEGWAGRADYLYAHAEATETYSVPLYVAPPAVLVEPAGWKLVPIEPTREMLMAAAMTDVGADDDGVHRLGPWLKALWVDMLAAAPSGVTKRPAPKGDQS